MRYTYTAYDCQDVRVYIGTDFAEIYNDRGMVRVQISDNMITGSPIVTVLRSREEIEEWSDKLSRDLSWVKPAVLPLLADTKPTKDATNPPHYQSYMTFGEAEVITYQWLEAMQHLTRYRNNPDVFKGAVELQARKYLDRLGGKDESSQEIMKSVWYLKFLAAYIKNGNKPIFVENIDKILAS